MTDIRPQATAACAQSQVAGPNAARIPSIDLLRGIIMVVMALDHVRDFTHHGAMLASPTDLRTTTPLLFATRWITHFCAPAFALLAGLGIGLRLERGDSKAALSRFLVTRGLWLMVLELVVMRFAYYFSFAADNPVLLLVLWSLGLSMVVLAAAIWVWPNMVAALAVGLILLHPLLDSISANQFGAWAGLWNVVHQLGAFRLGRFVIVAPYPLIPWVAVVALGYALGPLFRMERGVRDRRLFAMGAVALACFAVLRSINVYGDPVPWAPQRSWLFTTLSFLNVTKYPASPDFLLMTLGVIFLLLGVLDQVSRPAARWQRRFSVLGKVPLFYYVLHFYLAHLIVTIMALGRYGSAAFDFLFLPYPSMGGPAARFPPDFGYPLWVSYAVWLTVVLICYPLCRYYADLKMRRRDWWLSYL